MTFVLPKRVIVLITYQSSYLHMVTRKITTKYYVSNTKFDYKCFEEKSKEKKNKDIKLIFTKRIRRKKKGIISFNI
jgi:hypothetical protein